MKTQKISAFNIDFEIKIYKHSSMLYILSKLVKAINNNIDIPFIAYIDKDNSFSYKPVTVKTVVNKNRAGFISQAFNIMYHGD